MESPVIHIDWGQPIFCQWVCLSCVQKLGQHNYPRTHRKFIHQHEIPYNIVLDQGSHFPAKEMQQLTYNHGKSMFLLQCLPPRTHQLHRMVEWPLEDAAECHLGEDALLRWGAIFKEVIYTLNQLSLHGDIVSIGRRMDLGAKRWKQKWTQLS